MSTSKNIEEDATVRSVENRIIKTIKETPNKTLKYAKKSFGFYKNNMKSFWKEVLSGITVAILQVPESIAFSYVAGLNPIFGLYTTVFLGFVTAAFGGAGGMISGAAGALAVVSVDLTSPTGPLSELSYDLRVEHLLMTVIILGILQIIFGLFSGAALIALIPHPAMIGFLNGLAIVTFKSQLGTFKTCRIKSHFSACLEQGVELDWMKPDDFTTWMTFLVVALTMLVMVFWPKTPFIGKIIPASLMALLVGSVFEHGINRQFIHANIRTISDTASIQGKLFVCSIPNLGSDPRWGVIFQYAVMLGAIGLFESVMTLQVLGNILKKKITIFKTNQECFAQGLANFIAGIAGAMPGGAMIGETTANLVNGARGRLSGMVSGLTMLLFILVAAPAIGFVPIACLCGVLFVIIFHTFYWPTFKILPRIPKSDAFCIILVSVLAVATNLAISVISGVVWSALVNSWSMRKNVSSKVEVEKRPAEKFPSDAGGVPITNEDCTSQEQPQLKHQTIVQVEDKTIKTYHIHGPIQFSSIRKFKSLFTFNTDAKLIQIDFANAHITDFSGVNAIKETILQYESLSVDVWLIGIDDESLKLIRKCKWINEENIKRKE